MKIIHTLAALTITLVVTSTAAIAGNWSNVKFDHSNNPYISAESINESDAFLALHAYPDEQCSVLVSVIGFGDEPAKKVWEYDARILFRIDRNPVISTETTLEIGNYTDDDDGSVVGFVRSQLWASDDFLAQFVTGDKLIYKVEDPEDDEEMIETIRWSLSGSGEAFNGLLDACTKIVKGSDEWEEESPVKWKRDNYEGDEWES